MVLLASTWISSSPIQMNGTVAEISGACEYTLTPDGNIAVRDTATGPTVSKSSPKKKSALAPIACNSFSYCILLLWAKGLSSFVSFPLWIEQGPACSQWKHKYKQVISQKVTEIQHNLTPMLRCVIGKSPMGFWRNTLCHKPSSTSTPHTPRTPCHTLVIPPTRSCSITGRKPLAT